MHMSMFCALLGAWKTIGKTSGQFSDDGDVEMLTFSVELKRSNCGGQ